MDPSDASVKNGIAVRQNFRPSFVIRIRKASASNDPFVTRCTGNGNCFSNQSSQR
jgi:hypothetical protein